MVHEDDWALVVEATADPALTATPEQRLRLLRTALGLGHSITDDSVGCSVTLTAGSEFVTPAASNELAMDLDLAQYAAQDGPCVAACRDGEVHSIVVMSEEDLYPGFTAAAVQHGVGSSLSLPLPALPSAALNLYARSQNAFDEPGARTTAALLARCVARFLPEPVFEINSSQPGVATALRRRRLVRSACERLARDEGADPATAFTRIAVRSRTQRRSVFDVCADIMAESGTKQS